MLDGFDERMREIIRLTEKLSTEVAALKESADERVLVEVLEENRPGNIKRTFAKLYHAWNDLNAVFLASMLSTEWYTFTGVVGARHAYAESRVRKLSPVLECIDGCSAL